MNDKYPRPSPTRHALENTLPVVLVTGSAGLIGRRLIESLADEFSTIGLDIVPPSPKNRETMYLQCDLTDDDEVASAFAKVRDRFGGNLGSVVHLAAYYDFSGEPSPLYQQLTVEGTERLLSELHAFNVQQFIFLSTLLLMKPAEGNEVLTTTSPVEPEWDYPRSKLEAERVIAQQRGDIPTVILRVAGVYDDECHSIPLAQHISRIYEKQLESYLFPGNATHGQSFVHLDDVIDCIRRVIELRDKLPRHELFLVGEEDVMSYKELQDVIGTLIHGIEWPTIRIPKIVAKAGAWVREQMAGDDKPTFIKPWMIDLADQHYPVSLQHTRELLDWQPRRTLRNTLPAIIRRLQENPPQWYETNDLPIPEELVQRRQRERY